MGKPPYTSGAPLRVGKVQALTSGALMSELEHIKGCLEHPTQKPDVQNLVSVLTSSTIAVYTLLSSVPADKPLSAIGYVCLAASVVVIGAAVQKFHSQYTFKDHNNERAIKYVDTLMALQQAPPQLQGTTGTPSAPPQLPAASAGTSSSGTI